MSKSKPIGELFKALSANLSAAEIKSAMVIADISEKITEERISRGMTQKQFAEFMGVTQGMVSKWESSEYNFTIESLANIFDKLNLDFNFEINKETQLFPIDKSLNYSNIGEKNLILLSAG